MRMGASACPTYHDGWRKCVPHIIIKYEPNANVAKPLSDKISPNSHVELVLPTF